MTVGSPDAPDGMPGLLLDRGIPRSLRYRGMILILDAPGLIKALTSATLASSGSKPAGAYSAATRHWT